MEHYRIDWNDFSISFLNLILSDDQPLKRLILLNCHMISGLEQLRTNISLRQSPDRGARGHNTGYKNWGAPRRHWQRNRFGLRDRKGICTCNDV